MELSPRLQRLAAAAPPGLPIADIGTDHAYIPVHLVKTGRIPSAVGVEVHPGPLEAARQHVAAYGVKDKIDIRAGDGLAPLQPGEVGAIVIAGMGGGTIQTILTEGDAAGKLAGVSRLILQPLEGAGELRRWLHHRGWRIVEEDLVAEGARIYEVIILEPSGADGSIREHAEHVATEHKLAMIGDPLMEMVKIREDVFGSETGETSEELFWDLGPLLLAQRHWLLSPVVEKRIERERRALAGIGQARQPDEAKMVKIKSRLAALERVRAWLSPVRA
ncbi:hypothetical protein GTO89_01885 [Heliobacterium gestii]|uniref:SAM-dependent methyltransferase n=1 Tax=Heliomicrobium gestii TaxID=2699 RepID=A0A845LA19_HELGE|nr:class I SAM-dependent methyltransferase [Heliomicrobium gestii]MBM7865529.1 tRNA (adenine22-N1)-methyltransferase [Heliomicrobium gestii]MZP41780.1 hypothetical protein [Heliomicrobium gestii]